MAIILYSQWIYSFFCSLKWVFQITVNIFKLKGVRGGIFTLMKLVGRWINNVLIFPKSLFGKSGGRTSQETYLGSVYISESGLLKFSLTTLTNWL